MSARFVAGDEIRALANDGAATWPKNTTAATVETETGSFVPVRLILLNPISERTVTRTNESGRV
jgi:hypothetical protein